MENRELFKDEQFYDIIKRTINGSFGDTTPEELAKEMADGAAAKYTAMKKRVEQYRMCEAGYGNEICGIYNEYLVDMVKIREKKLKLIAAEIEAALRVFEQQYVIPQFMREHGMFQLESGYYM